LPLQHHFIYGNFEPLINKTKISKLEILAGLLIITGIILIFKFETQYTKGIIAGLASAVCAAFFLSSIPGL
jgi:drug/metabolite transporter (DMT)-like permease